MTTATRRVITPAPTRGDRIYRGIATGAAMSTLGLLGAIGCFLFLKAWPVLHKEGLSFFTEVEWSAGHFGVAAVVYWTVVIAAIGMVFAVPLAIAMALYITEYAPVFARKPLISLIDLLAAVPSLLYGLWGLFVLQPRLADVARFLSTHLAFVPMFEASTPIFKSSSFIAGSIVALMITPLITSVVREVLHHVPAGEKEAARALGATRWGMIRMVVLPFARGGIVGGSMLGLGRALGETIAVVLIISPKFLIDANWLESGSNSVASLIALRIGDAVGIGINALFAAGLMLFLMTLAVNVGASVVVRRSRSGAGVEL
jgi:phosphate transport system permease protein